MSPSDLQPRGSKLPTDKSLHQKDWFETRFSNLWQDINSLFGEMSSAFERMPLYRHAGRAESLFPTTRGQFQVPSIDVVEADDKFLISVDLPGMTEKDVEVIASNHHLTIRAAKKEQQEEQREGMLMVERWHGACQRTFELPPSVDQSKIDASLKDGVLTLTLGKTPEAKQQSRNIPIKTH